MKRVLIILLLFASLSSQSQFFSDYDNLPGSVRLGAGYSHDFPGLNGYAVSGEYTRCMSDHWQGAFGAKYFNMRGFPRTTTVQEYTKASTIDFGIYFVPFTEYNFQARLGIGYSFAFYNVRRSFPVFETTGTDKTASWKLQDLKGKSSGVNLIAEYAYQVPGSGLLLGLRAAWYKAYDRVTYFGPFAGIRF